MVSLFRKYYAVSLIVLFILFYSLIITGCGDSDDFVSGDKEWNTAQLIETDDSGNAESPQVAVDPDGNAVAVWYQFDGTRHNIWSNRYTADTGEWGDAEMIETDNEGDAWLPQVAVDPEGNAIAVWHQSDGTRFNIWSNRCTTGTWGTPELIETDNVGDAVEPQIAVDPGGNAIAVWYQDDGTFYTIWSNRYTSLSDTWGTAELIEKMVPAPAGHAMHPQIAVDSDGNAVAVWPQFGGTVNSIWSNRYISGTGWGTAELIETDDVGNAGAHQVAIDTDGNAIAVWDQYDGTRRNVMSNRYIPGTGWGTPVSIETGDEGTYDPQIAIDPDGNAIVVWGQAEDTYHSIWANRYTAGTGWGTAELIETDNTGVALNPQIAVDADGNAVAIWAQFDGTRYNIWSNRYTSGTGWGNAELIETNDGHAQHYQTAVAVDLDGNATAVWSQQSTDEIYSIWSNRFD